MNTFLGIDVGTTSLKMVLFDESGNALKTVSKAYTLDTRGDRVEFDPEQYWEMFSDGYRQIKEEYEVTALAIDTQCETLIVTDESGRALHNAIVWLDNRASAEAEAMDAAFGIHPPVGYCIEYPEVIFYADCKNRCAHDRTAV